MHNRRPGLYLSFVLTVTLGVSVYSCREQSLFACPVSGYGADGYLAYCDAGGYGDYDYGAFWFGLEPNALSAATEADVLFLGNSRMQFGLSSPLTDAWFEAVGEHYYLLGFAYNGNYRFAEPLIQRLQPKAQVYVINLDLFFEEEETPPARTVMHDSSAPARYRRKRFWQTVHTSVCSRVRMVCSRDPAFFRSRTTGAWRLAGGETVFRSAPVSYDSMVDERTVEAYAKSGERFLSALPARAGCQILTTIPTVDTPIGTARAVASRLGRNLIVPELSGLTTFDESHLDTASAERWSRAFFETAGPQIHACLDGSSVRGSNE